MNKLLVLMIAGLVAFSFTACQKTEEPAVEQTVIEETAPAQPSEPVMEDMTTVYESMSTVTE
jgi:hypothetical protein